MKSYYSYINERDSYVEDVERATYKGITIKTLILLAITVLTAVSVMVMLPRFASGQINTFFILLMVASIVGFICVLIGRLNANAAKVCSVIYSVCEGLLVGTITAIANEYYPEAGTFACTATLVIFTIMVVLFSCGIIRNGSKLRMVLLGLAFSMLSLFIFDFIYILTTGTQNYGLYILIQFAFLLYGVITLTFNFAEAEVVVKMGCYKEEEWSVSLGILVSLIYIYIYMLRLILIILSSSRR